MQTTPLARLGAPQSEDFIAAALDGLQYRIDAIQGLLDAIRATVEPEQPRKARSAVKAALPEATPAPRGKRAEWTPAKRRAAAARAKKFWATRQAAEKPEVKLDPRKETWTPERRAKMAAETRRRWKAGVYAKKNSR